jgi:hypothetical protein
MLRDLMQPLDDICLTARFLPDTHRSACFVAVRISVRCFLKHSPDTSITTLALPLLPLFIASHRMSAVCHVTKWQQRCWM